MALAEASYDDLKSKMAEAEAACDLDKMETITAFAKDMSEYLKESEITESRAFIRSFVMKDNTSHNQRDRQQSPVEEGRTPSEDMPTASYTPQQRRMIRKGLRVLARVAIRSHMRRRTVRSQDSPDDGEEHGR